MNRKSIIMVVYALVAMHTSLPVQKPVSVQPTTGWIESGINAVDTSLRITASAAVGMATGIFSAYGVKAVLKLLHMDNELTPKTGSVFALLSLGVMSKESSFRNGFIHYLTKNVSSEKKALIENAGNSGSWVGFLLVGLNPSSMFPQF